MRGPKSKKPKWIYWVGAGALLALIATGLILVVLNNAKEKTPMLEQTTPSPSPTPIKVCLDPGHGGRDPGAKPRKRKEKDDTLKIALRVQDLLKKEGIDCVMTRTDDKAVSLEERCAIAQREGANIMVSLHRNSGGGEGLEIWVNSQPTPEETTLSYNLHREILLASSFFDRGIRTGTAENPEQNLFINGNSNMTSCLVELGFIDNKGDNHLFDEDFDQIALAVARGIAAL